MAKKSVRLAPNPNKYRKGDEQTVKGSQLRPNMMTATRYGAKLSGLVTQMHHETLAAVREFFPQGAAMDAAKDTGIKGLFDRLSNRFTRLFELQGLPAAETMLQDANRNSIGTLGQSLKDIAEGVTLRPDLAAEGIATVLQNGIAENVDLIRKIPETYLGEVKQAVNDSISGKAGAGDLLELLEKRYDENKRHAELVAMDQTRKAYTALNVVRMDAAGVKKFQWVHTSGSREPREWHAHTLNGNIYSLDDPPIIEPKTGERGLPGQLINCRCIMRPIVSFED